MLSLSNSLERDSLEQQLLRVPCLLRASTCSTASTPVVIAQKVLREQVQRWALRTRASQTFNARMSDANSTNVFTLFVILDAIIHVPTDMHACSPTRKGPKDKKETSGTAPYTPCGLSPCTHGSTHMHLQGAFAGASSRPVRQRWRRRADPTISRRDGQGRPTQSWPTATAATWQSGPVGAY